SFCDGFPVDDVSVDTIEHFRPKCFGQFPQLAYTWTNLYYCCSSCQSHKGEKWDDELIAPDLPEYAFNRYFEFDFTTGAIRPSSTAGETEQRQAKATIQTYGLDTTARRRYRRLALKKWSESHPETRQLDEH